ncbi:MULTISPECIES: sigma-54-dependent transcriptional regulator [Bacteroides]|uniref:sigma-54-dependent transcriptional regulator n=1 Tax=Bacteroides TaxID=816 RepID=UPI001D4A38C9|nr:MULTISPECIES: sigma-54 dependent transcriptional regulator [Bacteroides]HJD92374.1 sigma-54 dependent transcriptional regulator [Bacteroides coprosuis]
MESILIVEDDITFGLMLKTWLTKKSFKISCVSTIADAKKEIKKSHFQLILSDMRLPDQQGEDLLKWIHQMNLNIPLIIMTSYADIQSAVRVMKLGAFDYIAKPFHPEDLLTKIKECLKPKNKISEKKSSSEQKEKDSIDKPLDNQENYIEGNSAAAKQLYKYVSLVAPTNMSVLIQGASGTGKEHVAHRIHQLSDRANKPFIAIDCGAIPKDLAASEFFGHVKGAFTGALENKTGALVAANGGTVFMDEIGNLSYNTQVQLLRALQERIIRPIGSNQEISVNIRLISATNEDLPTAIAEGLFREDLYHRINEFTVRVPDLAERTEDISLLANFFLEQSNKELNKSVEGFTPQAELALLQYAWPGNIRQLKNVIRKATLLAQEDLITYENLGMEFLLQTTSSMTNEPTQDSSHTTTSPSIELYDEQSEKEKIIAALKHTQNNKTQAAKLLKIDRKTLYNKLKLYSIDTKDLF